MSLTEYLMMLKLRQPSPASCRDRNFYPASAECMSRLYTENDEFWQNYARHRPGLADFMRAAITRFAEHTLS